MRFKYPDEGFEHGEQVGGINKFFGVAYQLREKAKQFKATNRTGYYVGKWVLIIGLLLAGLLLISMLNLHDSNHEIAEVYDAQLAQNARLLQGVMSMPLARAPRKTRMVMSGILCA